MKQREKANRQRVWVFYVRSARGRLVGLRFENTGRRRELRHSKVGLVLVSHCKVVLRNSTHIDTYIHAHDFLDCLVRCRLIEFNQITVFCFATLAVFLVGEPPLGGVILRACYLSPLRQSDFSLSEKSFLLKALAPNSSRPMRVHTTCMPCRHTLMLPYARVFL